MAGHRLFPSANRKQTGRFWQDHSLSIFLIGILLVQSVAYWFTELPDWRESQAAHQQQADLWPGYVMHYAAEYLVSILADTYGAVLLVLASKWFFERGSAESTK